VISAVLQENKRIRKKNRKKVFLQLCII